MTSSFVLTPLANVVLLDLRDVLDRFVGDELAESSARRLDARLLGSVYRWDGAPISASDMAE
jgi:hypothetical protein